MAEYYLNRTYPDSNRSFSRPYMGYIVQEGLTERGNVSVSRFRECLMEMGLDLLGPGMGEGKRLDLNPRYASATFFHTKDIVYFVENEDNRYQTYLDTLGSDHTAAVKNVVNIACRMEKRAHFNGSGIDSHAFEEGDKAAFLQLWQHDPLVDARLVHAEKFFADNHDEVRSWQAREEDAVVANLNWMAKPQNADKVAQMFLYSRLAQYFGEADPESFEFAQKLYRHPIGLQKAGQLLAKDPETLYARVMDPYESGLLSIGTSMSLTARFELFVGRLLGDGPCVQNRDSLRDTAGKIMEDTQALRDGSWARGMSARYNVSAPSSEKQKPTHA